MNMKKIALATTVVASILNGNVFAASAPFKIVSGKHIEAIKRGETAAEGKCEALSDNVVINLSRGVVGAYDCTPVKGGVGLATCHEGGNTKAGSVDCAIIANNSYYDTASGQLMSDPIYNGNQTQCTGTKSKFAIPNETGRAWLAGGSGGSMGGAAVSETAGAKCTQANIIAAVTFYFK